MSISPPGKTWWFGGVDPEKMSDKYLVNAVAYMLSLFYTKYPCFPVMKGIIVKRGLMDKVIEATNKKLEKTNEGTEGKCKKKESW